MVYNTVLYNEIMGLAIFQGRRNTMKSTIDDADYIID